MVTFFHTRVRPLVVAVSIAAMLALPAAAHALPTASIDSIVPGVNPTVQHVDGSTIWVRPGTTGSFDVRVTADSDNIAGVDHVRFPAIGAGWSPAAPLDVFAPPFETTYSFGPASVDPGLVSSIVVHDADPSTADVGFSVVQDGIAPIGSILHAQGVATRDSAAPVRAELGSDAQSGIGAWHLQRRTASLGSGACIGWTGWGTFATNPVGSISDPLPTEGCYQYRLLVVDNVGNTEVVEQQSVLSADRTVPGVSIDTIDERSVTGNSAVELQGVAVDAGTGVRAVSVIVEDRYSICSNAAVDAAGRWSCTWNIDYTERTGPANLKVSIVDYAGNRSHAAVTVNILPPPNPFGPREEDIDRTAPVVGLARMPLVSWNNHVRVKATAYDDRPGFIDIRMEQQTGTYKAVGFGKWFPALHESAQVSLEERGETTCFRAIATDLLGNTSTSYPRCTTMPLDDQDMKARGRWDELDHRRAYQGSMRRTSQRGASLTLRVSDATPQLVVTKCRTCGYIRVYHGKRFIGAYRLRSKKSQFRRVINLRKLRRPSSAPLRIVNMSKRPILIDGLIARQ
jgi:hypothetical protein